MSRAFPEVAGVEHSYVDAAGLRTHVAQAGRGDPVLLLHGWPQHWYAWRGVIPPLAENFRVIAPDLRGFGWTDAPRFGYEKETLAADVIALLDELEIEKVKLVGHDWGGWISYLLCMLYPHRVERYVALNIAHPWPQSDPSDLLRLWRFAYQWVLMTPGVGTTILRNWPQVVDAMIKNCGGPKDTWTDAELREFSEVLQEPERARASAKLYGAFQTKEMIPIIRGRYSDRRLAVPTLNLHGVGDPVITPDSLGGIDERADDYTLELIEGAGHFIAEDQPELVAQRVAEFFSQS